MLVDTTLCIGCRKCEEACNRRNHLPRTADSFSDRDVLRTFRRPSETAFTVVNQFPGSPSPDQAGLAADLLQGAVHALPVPLLRLGLHRGRADQVAGRGRGLQSRRSASAAGTARSPARSRSRPTSSTSPSSRACASASSAADRAEGHRCQSRLRGLLPDRGAGLRPPRRSGRHGQGAPEAPARPLCQPHLRRTRGGRDLLAIPDRAARAGGRAAEPARHPAAATDRGHPARHLQVRHHPRRRLRPVWRHVMWHTPSAASGRPSGHGRSAARLPPPKPGRGWAI